MLLQGFKYAEGHRLAIVKKSPIYIVQVLVRDTNKVPRLLILYVIYVEKKYQEFNQDSLMLYDRLYCDDECCFLRQQP